MNYGTIKDINAYITSAALAPKPTLKQRFVMLIKSSRPPGWTFGPILYGIGTIHSGAIPNTLGALAISAVQIVTLSFPLCIVVFGINDIYDYASDVLNPRKSITSLEGTILPPAHHPFVRRAAIISSGVVVATSTLPAFYGSSLVSWNSVIPVVSTAALVALGWAYSAPPTRLKEIPIIDSISNGVIVWMGLLVGYSSCRTLVDLPWGFADIPLKGYAVGLVTASVHAIGAAADIDADVASGQRTIATLVGRRGCAAFGVAAYAISLVIEDKIPETIFRIYLIGGLLANFSACLYPSPTGVHRAFQAIVWWTVIMAVVWFGAQVGGMLNL